MSEVSVGTAQMDMASRPLRLHHTAYVTKDQAKTRAFYEDLIGLPLVATWKEQEQGKAGTRSYVHTFYALADGSALAFFQFADPDDQARMGPDIPPSPAIHVALKVSRAAQDEIAKRLEEAAWRPEATSIHDHGYCRSLYTRDPNGMLLEFTADADEVDDINATRRATARADLEAWLAGDYTTNNPYR